MMEEIMTTTNVIEHAQTEIEKPEKTPATPKSRFAVELAPGEAEYWDPIPSTPVSPDDLVAVPSWKTEPARYLAWYLFCFLSVRDDVEVLPRWEEYWTKDFQEALESGWSLADLGLAIRMSQFGKAREYYKRGASIVRNLELLVNNGQKLQERGLLVEVECHSCSGLLVGDDALAHLSECYGNKPADPEDVAEEEAMWVAEELVSEGYVKEHPGMQMFYSWSPDDVQMFDPRAGVPEQLSEPKGKRGCTEEEQETIPLSPESVSEEEPARTTAIRAEHIVDRLIRVRNALLPRGYGSPQLVFSDGSYVSLTCGGALCRVTELLQAGAEPLGFIACLRERRGPPFVKTWEHNDQETHSELCRSANWLYGHRFITIEEQK